MPAHTLYYLLVPSKNDPGSKGIDDNDTGNKGMNRKEVKMVHFLNIGANGLSFGVVCLGLGVLVWTNLAQVCHYYLCH